MRARGRGRPRDARCVRRADGSRRDAGDGGRTELGRGQPLTGPVFVEGAEPGDLLEVDILDVEPDRYGYTV
jgi:acetamidase/formamidase